MYTYVGWSRCFRSAALYNSQFCQESGFFGTCTRALSQFGGCGGSGACNNWYALMEPCFKSHYLGCKEDNAGPANYFWLQSTMTSPPSSLGRALNTLRVCVYGAHRNMQVRLPCVLMRASEPPTKHPAFLSGFSQEASSVHTLAAHTDGSTRYCQKSTRTTSIYRGTV